MRNFILTLVLLTSFNANAGNLYLFKDKDGNTLLTNNIAEDGKPNGEFAHYDKQINVTWYPDCVPDTKKWAPSSAYNTYFSNEAVIFTLKNSKRRFIQTWINTASFSEAKECSFSKKYLTIDCLSSASGDEWYSVSPADPDSNLYSVIKNICAAFPEKIRKIKK